ncbi:hypothetical protein BSL78_28485 [Apostichopus japonicus]|uniref:Uncharacterized protein n=1 Tax=Stichopus japonicus TaxID=307972 RepID=A0A2G8JG29_STIJA|nr:hypothetical protein BSL78_28485 [Apostichopus japonicus]
MINSPLPIVCKLLPSSLLNEHKATICLHSNIITLGLVIHIASLPHGEKKTQLVTDPDKQQEVSREEPKEDFKETQGNKEEGILTRKEEKVDVKAGDKVPNVPVLVEEHKDEEGQDIEGEKDEEEKEKGRITEEVEKLDVKVRGDVPSGDGTAVEVEEQKDEGQDIEGEKEKGRITGEVEKLDVKVGGDVPSGDGTAVEVEEHEDAKEKEMVRFDEKAEIFHEKEQEWDKLGIGNIVILLDEKQKYEINMINKENDRIIASHPVRKEY